MDCISIYINEFAWSDTKVFGVGGGWIATRFIADRANLAFVFDAGNAFLALTIAFSLNLLFAAWPAMRAAKLDPIDALRHE